MSNADILKAVLAADTTLVNLLTGGLYTYAETLRLGVSEENTPSAFDDNGILKPCCLIHARAQVPFGGIADPSVGFVSTRQVVELYFYDDGDAGYATIQSARALAFTLLNDKKISGAGKVRWINTLDDLRAEELDYAALIREDYAIVGSRSGS